MSEKRSRTTEKVLGIIGGIFGMFGGFFASFMGAMGEAFSGDSGGLGGLGASAFVFSILGIVSACLVYSKTKFAGWGLIISAVGIIISISLFGVIPGILFLISGIMTLAKKEKTIVE
ncbi:hypothetical protein [Caldisalinibacter kiritimatiensis]|uniref:DUF4064 domain-containing protein n=1 Tax=Caldisalinibacter kiritimatiensis TaxID=1304284 RepID=R1CD28_9FIRM|nr:hypothetical protein [Caldisalinibacter kiritimatiensis]EOD00200.1 hypothetical protein L21TH_1776 [Caldisalinibacter kiritimatiensis]